MENSKIIIKKLSCDKILSYMEEDMLFNESSLLLSDVDVSESLYAENLIKSFSIMFFNKETNTLKIKQFYWNLLSFNSVRSLLIHVLRKYKSSNIEINLCDRGFKLFKSIIRRENIEIKIILKNLYFDEYYKEYKNQLSFVIL